MTSTLEAERQSRAGCVQLRRSRETGLVVGIYNGMEAGLDTDEGRAPWSIVCEEHGFISSFDTLTRARQFAPYPRSEGWCEMCSGSYNTIASVLVND